MTEDELKRIIDNLSSNAINAYDSDDQGDALDYYYGRPYGNEEFGRSQVTTLEVQEAIEWSLPGLIRVFVGGDVPATFSPVGPEDEEAAEQETDMVNHVFTKENNGFLIMYDWLKDSLLQRNGYIKIYWNEEEEVKTEVYEGLLDIQLAEFDGDENIEITEHTAREELEQTIDQMGMPQTFPVTYHDIKIKRTIPKKGIRIENIPCEEMKVSKNARSISLDEADYVQHETTMKATDLLEMGVDPAIVDMLSGGESDENDLDYERAIDQENAYDDDQALDKSMRDIKVKESVLWVDYDGDGKAEYRKVLKSGNYILINEEIDYCPFESLTPVRMPHQHQGMSKADQVMPIQLIKSTLLRQMLDNLYLTNNPEKEVDENNVNIDDLLSSTPGGIKRVTQMGSIREIAVPFTAAASMPVMDMLDTMLQKRTGITYNAMALDPNVLANSTKGAFMGALEKGNEQMELMARLLAETGIKGLFRKIHHLLRKHQDVPKTVKIRGKWVNVSPQEWRERNDLEVSVGLGAASKDSLIQRLITVAGKQLEALQLGLPVVTPQNYYKTLNKLTEAVDLGEGYFTDPSTIPPKPPQPDPNAQLLQLQQAMTQMQEETKRMKQESDNQVKQMELQLKAQELAQKDFIERMKEATARAKLELEYDQNVPGSAV